MLNKRITLIALAIGLLILCGTTTVALLVWRTALISEALSADQTATPMPPIERVPEVSATSIAEQPATSTAEAAPVSPTEAAIQESTPTPTVSAEADPPSHQNTIEVTTEQKLLRAILPERDQRLLAMRLKNGGAEIPTVARETPLNRQLGDSDTFWVTDNQQIPPRQFQVEAILSYITDHSYWWVQEGFDVDAEALKQSAEQFENNTYPTNRDFFGSEWSPGVDGDERVHIFMGDVPGVAGYFSASNEYTKLAEPYSNEREMFFINLRAITPGNNYFDGVLAHEFQHMIHWHQDRNEDTWVNEGMSELATFINGYGSSNFVGAFTATPDTQLTGWADTPSGATANYGGSFLFMAYFLQRYGEELTQAVVSHPQNGIAGFNIVLEENGYSERFDDIFADFVVANYLNDPDASSGLWGYQDFTPGAISINKLYRNYPQQEQATVDQFGSDYIELNGQGDVTVAFTGSSQVKVLANEAHSGSHQWYSHRGDDTNTRLTRAFDLSDVDRATLNYWTWYDIETDWDYGYVEVSTDGGTSWTILETPHSATTNPTGNAYGPGYTGQSGGQDGPVWVEESLDLSAYTGQEILLRFEYVTDDAVNRSGWSLDDIRIPEIGFFDDAESDGGDWEAEGFVRIDNMLPQHFLVQVIEMGETITVRQISLDDTNYGTLMVEGLGSTFDRAVLIVSGLTQVTTQPAGYAYELTASQ